MLLEIKDLVVESDKKQILKGIDLKVKEGEVQAILGPNACGKSTLAQVIAGNPRYKITKGKVIFKGKNINELPAEKRVKMGMAITWQHPPEVKGVLLSKLLDKISSKKKSELCFAEKLLDRETNVNFSGGERKLSELVQVVSLNPKLVIFDEIDSGLDIKKLECVSNVIKKEFIEKNIAVIFITHNGKILNFLKPSRVNVIVDGRIICKEKNYKKVMKTIEKYGYEKCKKCELHPN